MKKNWKYQNEHVTVQTLEENDLKNDVVDQNDQVMTRLKYHKGRYSPGQRKIAEFVLGNPQTAAFCTGKKLAEASGVSEATINRFVGLLEYKGYLDFQGDLQQHVMSKFKGDKRFKASLPCVGSVDTPLTKFLEREIENISSLQQNFNLESFRQAVQAIQCAEKVVIVGVRGSAALAWRLWFGLNKIRFNVTKILEISEESFEIADRLAPEDVVVAIGFPRYLASMVRLLKNAATKRVQVVSITGNEFSFVQGEINLYCQAQSTTFIANHCAPTILINALIHEVSFGDQERTLKALKDFETLAEKNEFFARHA